MTTPAVPDLNIPGVYRIENISVKEGMPMILDMTRAVYPHDDVYGQYCTVQDFIDAPPDEVFEYLSDPRSLEEWTYSMRGFEETEEAGLWISDDRIGDNTKIYTRTVSSPDARTVDYHCAWDQDKHLWMIYLMRVIDAQVVLNKPGSVVLWTNCHHPFYDENPYPETAPSDREPWVGDFWELFYAGHLMELRNLKAICEHRYAHGQPITPEWMR
ncbi:SRPBCC family protein (plasmid) [Rhodococcus oxybenzonivorans]|uniref:SRPBCC family protein n=1 Tax=Rhodococcus oxybenzonivorans TaxID=1990687 RepID=A0A2S2C7P9_9NOCA|nr:SRPBCC family protein [Rhodococcus oxybenzonivorans]AWK76818.1 SRPBCC family protein [Rhodococcus oxybenzonivorans]